MGRFLAALLIALAILWLRPMCAVRPAGTAEQSPVAPVAPAVTAAPAAPRPSAERPPIVIRTRALLTPFLTNGVDYGVPAVLESRSALPAEDLLISMFTRVAGVIVQRSETAYPWTVSPGATAHFRMPSGVETMNEILARPTAAGTSVEWSLSYRLAGEDPDSRRCFRIRAVPRREGGGIAWRTLEQTSACDAENMPAQTGPEGDFRNLAR